MSDDQLFDDLGDRQCRRCQAVRPLQEFPASLRANGTVKFGSYCPPCQKAYQHQWYLANRDKHRRRSAARKEALRVERPAPPDARPLREAIGFRRHPNSRVQGDAGLGIAIAYFSRLGVRVGIPLTDSQPYDLLIDNRGELSRV
ncbi:MAG TPA: group I intron-associated PD-(D/E)XK endonuclease, partial [Acidimicrobiia bacterium]